MQEIITQLRQRLQEAVSWHSASAMLLSGGLDTSILAYLCSPHVEAINIQLEDWGEDGSHAERLCGELGLPLYRRRVTVQEALQELSQVIRIRRSFDPALPNDLAIYLGLRMAREHGFSSVMTGDGADELFAGYSYMQNLDLKLYLPELAARMSFSSNELAAHLGLEVRQPFLDREFVHFALSIPPELKIRNEGGRVFGKWVLRKAFEGLLPAELIWQSKRPIELGSGFSKLRDVVAELVPRELAAVGPQGRPIRFLSPDHPYYYWVYCQVVGEVPTPSAGQESCPGCGTGLPASAWHCRLCGWCKEW